MNVHVPPPFCTHTRTHVDTLHTRKNQHKSVFIFMSIFDYHVYVYAYAYAYARETCTMSRHRVMGHGTSLVTLNLTIRSWFTFIPLMG